MAVMQPRPALFTFLSSALFAIPIINVPKNGVAFAPSTLTQNLPRQTKKKLLLSRDERMASSSLSLSSWNSGTEVLDLDPSTLCKGGVDGTPQLAKDEDYASAVLKGWRDELSKRPNGNRQSVSSPLVYQCKGDDSPLHGHIYRQQHISKESEDEETSLPGVILFHTGAGPQDIFLRWKADSLVTNTEVFGDKGCVVLIADILGDDIGWAWYDREKYSTVRQSVLVPDENGERTRLQGRVRAAIDALSSQPGVDPKRIGAMGFCLGGHPILEMARMTDPSVKALATFHGVFDGVHQLNSVESCVDIAKCNVLVCTGADDPFVPSEDLDAAMKMFSDLGYQSEVMKFERTRHGFTNPAQDFNPSDAFAYSEEAYTDAWSATLSLMKSKLS